MHAFAEVNVLEMKEIKFEREFMYVATIKIKIDKNGYKIKLNKYLHRSSINYVVVGFMYNLTRQMVMKHFVLIDLQLLLLFS